MLANLCFVATAVTCTILFLFAYCKKKEYLILPAYLLISIVVLTKLLGVEG